ncbi:hypothetical protein MSG28_006578 [Choristoneura fumiferana]|uniref:Uncharacterized protein n=1 Tax=Choristoneura fumiferana TaxID=7141 RepID=A0ACC0JFJ4_CHOFU|nr:hypothetical protein MSG28_006578 [Choristoneura fumiferana]
MHRKTRKRDQRWESNPGPQQSVLRAITPTPPLDRNLDTNFSYAYISQSAVHNARHWSFIEQKTLSMALAMFGQHMAVSKLARELLFDGYDDAILDVARVCQLAQRGARRWSTSSDYL